MTAPISNTPLLDRIAARRDAPAQPEAPTVRRPAWLARLQPKDLTGAAA